MLRMEPQGARRGRKGREGVTITCQTTLSRQMS